MMHGEIRKKYPYILVEEKGALSRAMSSQHKLSHMETICMKSECLFSCSGWGRRGGGKKTGFSTFGSISDCRFRACRFKPQLGHITFVEIDHEIISAVIFSLSLIEDAQ